MTGAEEVSFRSETLEHILSKFTRKIDHTISKIDSVSDTLQKQSDSIHNLSTLFDTLQQTVTTQQTVIADMMLKLSNSQEQSSGLKLDVPLFSGDNVLIWIFQMEKFFAFHQTPGDQRLNIAPFYMTGVALNWYNLMHRTSSQQLSNWEAFTESLELRFLNHEMSTLSPYLVKFEALAARTCTPGLANLLDSFISGLRDNIKREMLKLKPSSLSEAMCMALLVEAAKLQFSPISPSLSENDSLSSPEEPQGTSKDAQPQISLHTLEGTVIPLQRTINDDDVTSLAYNLMPTPIATETGLRVGGNTADLDSAGCFFEVGRRRSYSNDFISQMPDEVLVTILSLLHIKDAVATSILSTRWRFVWRNLTQVNFNSFQTIYNKVNMDSERDKFINQVNSVIESYNHQTIQDFRIRYDMNNNYNKVIDEWIQFAVNKKVEFLELDLMLPCYPIGEPYNFPLGLFERYLSRSNAEVVELVSLNKLILNHVNVTEAVLQELLSNSPNLETLYIHDPQYLYHIRVGGRALKLKYFQISDGSKNLESIYLSDFDLETFIYCGAKIDIRFARLPKLRKVDLGGSYWRSSGDWKWCLSDIVFDQISSCASSLQSLYINIYRDEKNLKPYSFPELPNVKHLRMMCMGHKHNGLLDLAYVFNACPNLESFQIQTDWIAPIISRKKARDATNPHNHLRLVEIEWYDGRKCDFELAAYIIHTAVALKKIVIMTPNYYDRKKKEAAKSSAKRLKSLLRRGVELVILDYNPQILRASS